MAFTPSTLLLLWLGELPVRLMVDYEGRFEIEARVDNMHWASFEYDPDLVPIVADADDPFADSQDIRVFVAKGVYIQADPEAVDRAMQFVAGFTPAVIARISAALVELPSPISNTASTSFLYGQSVHTHPDPVAALEAGLTLVAELASALGGQTACSARLAASTAAHDTSSAFSAARVRTAEPLRGVEPSTLDAP